ncbi:MAG: alpha-amylase family glycosyl hydrolase [Myxococcota bacterium]|nr:alpha-amylase family glycosyl hydrolase [Myxococcota bacterium]
MAMTPYVSSPLLTREAALEYLHAQQEIQALETPQGSAQLARTLQAKHDSAFSAGAYYSMIALQRAMDALTRGYLQTQPERLDECLEETDLKASEIEKGFDSFNSLWSNGSPALNSSDLLKLQALAENPALLEVESLLGTQALVSDAQASAGSLSLSLRETEAETEPTPGFSDPLGVMLTEPARRHQESLKDQLVFILENWESWLDEETKAFLTSALDLLEEEDRFRGHGPGPAQLPGLGGFNDQAGMDGVYGNGAYGFGGGLKEGDLGYVDDKDRFSMDQAWMPNLILIAKQTYVWLHQLAQEYQREIRTLDQIPDEELDMLAARGFSGLWLIGLWERSPASQNIKRRRGNPEAESSAYSLKGYRIADRLGGQGALERLRVRAESRGIRLAADMVPNHMGMDSDWMAEHPDWFLQLPHSPYPGYSFNGPDLSGDGRIQIRLEDGYWSESDAAVVFQCVNNDNGQVRYIYHGNDGTQMPWNDTAQLDYLQPAVREAVIQVILNVAREFRIIRFDAAMTLARKHIQRLWYPPPGHGGAIPSRSENSVDLATFNQQVPGEFWREVVDRVAQEVPDTLLLAEAFWMMEGYFVRTLGMHRVYNSAFMHMLRDEDNAKYRQGIRDTLAYSPAVLNRYVNFMNNPDEETAAEQFGKGGKYFGIATMMSTLPGLPMFGHGQVEGFTEKYGMEYTRAYRDERPDFGLVEHHERVIFPILRSRHLFSGVDHFAFFDARNDSGVEENIYAFSNRSDITGGRSLVLYNNAYSHAAGWISQSSPINVGSTDEPQLIQKTLAEALELPNDPNLWVGLRNLQDGRWLIRNAAQLHGEGFFVSLEGYQCLVFSQIENLNPHQNDWRLLNEYMNQGWIDDLDSRPWIVETVEPEPAEEEEFPEASESETEPIPGTEDTSLEADGTAVEESSASDDDPDNEAPQ